jgi:hypothetical protein
MSTLSYGISFDLPAKLAFTAAINKETFPLLHQAVRAVAKQTSIEWQKSVLQASLWSEEKDRYAASIKWEMTGDFSAVVQTDYKYAGEIETGRPAKDLKRMLDTSSKVRRTEDGRRFLVIPFRHNTPGNDAHADPMPTGVHAMAKAMESSLVTAIGKRNSGEVTRLSPTAGMSASGRQSAYLSNTGTKQHETVAQRSYQWGGRLTKGALKQAGMSPAEQKRYAGLVKFNTSTPGGATSSSYMTFRIMMEGSKGWIVPAQPGRFIAKNVVDQMGPKAQVAFAGVMKKMTGA